MGQSWATVWQQFLIAAFKWWLHCGGGT